MTIRDLKASTIRRLATEADSEFDLWFKRTAGKLLSTGETIPMQEVWRLAFSKGAGAILRRVDNLKD